MTATQPPDVLARIAADRRRRIEEMKLVTPGHVLRSRLHPPAPAGRLERALRRGGAAGPIRLLCEIKRASPSRGLLRPNVDPPAIARMYEAGGAAAISVVTEPDHFQGDLAWLDRVRATVQIPVLLKDFVIDSYQLLDAAARGADAVLLIASLLSEVQMQRLIGEARLLGLDCLVEVHDAVELASSLRAGATLVGINNRDLRTFETSLETTLLLRPDVPADRVLVTESGIATREDVTRMRAAGVDAFLVGETFMRASDPGAELARLFAGA
jgi:indole-3-glycerol phosphate synthase